MEHLKRLLKGLWNYIKIYAKWLIVAALTGAFGGVVGSVFHLAIEGVTHFRGEHPWILWLLPVGGVIIAAGYHVFHKDGLGINQVINSIRSRERIPLLLLPLIFVSTVITHLCGGSAGREGAALQLGGSIGAQIGRWLHLDEKDMHIVTLCGMSAVFSALFGTPLTAAFFALEVISVGVVYYSGLVPCTLAALTAYGISLACGAEPTRYVVELIPQLTVLNVGRVMLLAAVVGLVSIVFCLAMHSGEHFAAKFLKNIYLRAAVGGCIIVALTLAVGSGDYNGAGSEVITRAIAGEARPEAFALKIIFTAITIGCGFKGGEVVPTFFIGATLGCVLGPILGLPAGFAAAIGLIAMFCGAVNCPVASALLSIELFGGTGLVFFFLSCGVSFLVSGYYGLYSSQKILYSKYKAEYININAK